MSVCRLISYDLRNGMLQYRRWMIMAVLGGTAIFVDFWRKLRFFTIYIPEMRMTFSDLLFYAYGGMEIYHPSRENGLEIPIIWIGIFALTAYSTMNYPMQDISETGMNAMVKGNGRINWWLSKCFWCFSQTLLFHAILILTIGGGCLFGGIPISKQIHTQWIPYFYELSTEYELLPIDKLNMGALLLVIACALALNFIQMLIGIMSKPVFGFLAILIVLISSAYYHSPLLIGNYGMFLRMNWIYSGGVSICKGWILVMVILIFTMVSGCVIIKRKDFY